MQCSLTVTVLSLQHVTDSMLWVYPMILWPRVSFLQVFDQVDVDNGYKLWPADKLEYSAVGLDVGYWDGGYYHFAVHPRNADIAGGSENFFLHITRDGGATWQSPFTRFRDCGARSSGKRWSSTGKSQLQAVPSVCLHAM